MSSRRKLIMVTRFKLIPPPSIKPAHPPPSQILNAPNIFRRIYHKGEYLILGGWGGLILDGRGSPAATQTSPLRHLSAEEVTGLAVAWGSPGRLLSGVHSREKTWKPKRVSIRTAVLLKEGHLGFHISLGECTSLSFRVEGLQGF